MLQILDEVLTDISISQDKVSKELSALYKRGRKPSVKDIEKARLRKEIGNPPGKNADPLGDQLSWEQLLKITPKTEQLWIVSTDRDYFTGHKKHLYLNPILYNDLKQLNRKIKVKTFNILSEALRDFNKMEKIVSIPSQKELDKISIVESQDSLDMFNSSGTIYSPKNLKFSQQGLCFNCGEACSIIESGYTINKNGRKSLLLICSKCGFPLEYN